MKILVSISGGKDSQAVLNYCLKRYKKSDIIPYFCDTGWEADETYKHLEYLEKTLDIKITYLKSDKYDGFEDMCIKRKGFPSRVRRFCTEELKIIPSTKFIRSFLDKGIKVKNFVGVRKQESKKRAGESKYKTSFLGTLPRATKRKDGSLSIPKKAKQYYSKENSVTTIQPIVDWDEKEVYEFNIKCGTKNNPLYQNGYKRVGCFPCINANKNEIGLLPANRVAKVIDLEKKVQATTTKTRPVFFHRGDAKLTDFSDLHNLYKYNTLDLDLGCINHLGICE